MARRAGPIETQSDDKRMTTECYFKQCPFHSTHSDKDDGPYCYERKCLATDEKCIQWQAERDAELAANKREVKA